MRINSRQTNSILAPSWLSGFLAVAVGLFVALGTILAFSFNNSQIQQQLVGLQNTSEPALTLPGEQPPGTTQNSLQNTWPLLGFWAIVGLIVYFLVETVVQSLRNIAELREELDYVHVRREVLLKTAAEFLLIRLAAGVAWLIFIALFFRRIIPYSITAAHASASDLHSPTAAVYALLSFVMIVLSLHLHAIFLRLALRRVRVFSRG